MRSATGGCSAAASAGMGRRNARRGTAARTVRIDRIEVVIGVLRVQGDPGIESPSTSLPPKPDNRRAPAARHLSGESEVLDVFDTPQHPMHGLAQRTGSLAVDDAYV